MTQEPRDPNAPPPQTPEGDSPIPPEQGGAPPPQGAAAPPPQGAAAPPPQQSWQSQPQQPGAPPPAGGQPAGSGTPAWVGTLTDQTPVAGPAGYYYADVPNRSIAMIIDVIGVIVVYFIVGVITLAIFGTETIFGVMTANPLVLLTQSLVSYAIWAAYFIYTWVNMRGTLGMKALGLQIGHQEDGRSLTYEQGAYRYGVLFGPIIVIGLVTSLIPALSGLGLLSFLWFIYVLYTMAQSPTKQGVHDRYAKSMVVKGGRSVG